ncbi:MAG: SCO family protein [Oligoflexia bacterium]|nr:SCO family protein [Oligoflexia bacterium]
MTESVTGYIRKESALERLVSSKAFWALLILLVFTYPIYRSVNRTLPAPLPKYYQVPEFNFVNQFNKPFGSNDLKGRFYVASFAFTTCPTTCPRLMEKLKVVQKRVRGLGNKIAILTFTVDPEYDTPQVLKRHSHKLKANPYVWTFLTGKEAELRKIVVDGFKVPMGKREEIKGVVDATEVTMFDIAHTEKLVLVDDQSNVRGYYSIDDNGLNKLMIDIGLLVNRKYN